MIKLWLFFIAFATGCVAIYSGRLIIGLILLALAVLISAW